MDATPHVPEVLKRSYWRPCDRCGTAFRVYPSSVRKAIQRGCNPPRYCSMTCRNVAYQGAGNPKWRGGRTMGASGYVLVMAPNHPQADKHGYYEEHRLVMERHLGRVLKPTEVVHHFNHDKTDNRIENLELMESQAQHRRRHGYYEPRECANCGTTIMRSQAMRRRWVRSFCSRTCAAAAASRANAAAAKRRRA